MQTGARPALRVVELGDGPPVLLLHGFTGSVEAWGDLPVRLGEHARVLAVDLPGHGGSGAAPDPADHDMAAVHARLEDVLDACGVGACTWVGYSMGARVALGAAVRRPERVSALVLEGGSPGLATEAERAERRALDEERAARLEAEGVDAFVRWWTSLPIFESQARRLDPDRLRRERDRRAANRARGLAASLRGLGTGSQPSFWEALPGVGVPTLLLTGADDPKFGAIAARMAERMPAAEHRVVEGAGHAVHVEAPDAWLEAVAAHLARVHGEAPGRG